MSANYRVVRYAAGGLGIHLVEYDDTIPPGTRKGSMSLSKRKILGWGDAKLAATEGEGIMGLRSKVASLLDDPTERTMCRDAFNRPHVDESDLPRREP